ncbi:hypothetical protein H6P81_016322 [Aristolochia fimbriata]|uniref:Reverse transcriptase domain-containing protein n=1 Tax=Aristolochia fimbriata TaxID=158543 RepID=A0AAV7E812_ARIFI|nr:hypothetical protein H6P81_016322 [Aristolochia fimbriata]
MMKDNLERYLVQSCTKEDEDPLMKQEVEQLEAERHEEEEKGAEIKDASKLELKPLPSSLKYVYLENNSIPVIISSCLNAREEQLLIKVLSKHKKAIGWTILDIKGISPTTCMHKILLEDSFKPTIQPQRRLNKTLQEVVKKEVVKLLDAGEKRLLDLNKLEELRYWLNELEELRYWDYDNASPYKLKTKRWHDKNISMKNFEVGQKVLLLQFKIKTLPWKIEI